MSAARAISGDQAGRQQFYPSFIIIFGLARRSEECRNQVTDAKITSCHPRHTKLCCVQFSSPYICAVQVTPYFSMSSVLSRERSDYQNLQSPSIILVSDHSIVGYWAVVHPICMHGCCQRNQPIGWCWRRMKGKSPLMILQGWYSLT